MKLRFKSIFKKSTQISPNLIQALIGKVSDQTIELALRILFSQTPPVEDPIRNLLQTLNSSQHAIFDSFLKEMLEEQNPNTTLLALFLNSLNIEALGSYRQHSKRYFIL